MTPSQLLNAAELLLARDKEVRELFARSHGKEAAPTMEYHLARHILSTVREDDGEEIDEDWFIAQCGVDQAYIRGDFFLQFVTRGAVSLGYQGNETPTNIHTRGDFRALCSLLGVQLKEPA